MGTTACIKEEQCIGPGSGGRRWRRLRSSPVCLNQRFQKPERVGERAAPPCGQIVFDTPTPPPPPHSLFSLLWGIFFFFFRQSVRRKMSLRGGDNAYKL